MQTIRMKAHPSLFHLSLIAAFACLVYSNTFSVPFHFDDKLNIVDNAWIKDLENFWPPSGTRWFGYLTFAFNYRLGGLDVVGYHAVNLVIHVLNSFLVYWLALITLRTPFFWNDREWRKPSNLPIALAAGLIFAVHPVQTQAVTYIVQRFASLAALWYLLSLTLYAKARMLGLSEAAEAGKTGKIIVLYAFAVLSALLAMKTKEIAFTLPLAVIAYDICFFSSAENARKYLPAFIPLLLGALIVPLVLIAPGMTLDVASRLSATNEISRHDYLLTQFRVLPSYLRLLLLPFGQSIDHAVPVSSAFFDPAVLVSFLFLIALFGAGLFLFFRSRSSCPLARVAAFGVFWFFITASVESSIVPIADVMVEHRMYLPSVGIILAFVAAFVYLMERFRARHAVTVRAGIATAVILIVLLSTAAYSRNTVWQSELTLWTEAVKSYPENARGYNMLGILYQRTGRLDEAMAAYRTAAALNPFFAEAHVNLGRMHTEGGRFEEAMREFMTAVNLGSLDDVDTANLYINIGYCYQRQGLPDKAIEFYQYAASIVPDDASVYSYLARAYKSKGMRQKATEHFNKARKLDPDRF